MMYLAYKNSALGRFVPLGVVLTDTSLVAVTVMIIPSNSTAVMMSPIKAE